MSLTAGRLTHLAPWFAFAGRAFLTADVVELAEEARELGDDPLERALVQSDPVALEKEYVRLFLNPAGASCAPWQSVHDREARLMGPTHFGALSWFRTEDIEPQPASLPADHVGLLLAFFAHLIEAGVFGSLLDYYWHEHLEWIPPFCASLEAAAEQPFYKELARITSHLVQQCGAELDQECQVASALPG